jgi:murein hydrolase activator
MKTRFFLCCSLALLMCASPVWSRNDDSAENRKAELEKIADEIRKHKTQLSNVEVKEARVISTLSTIEKQLAQQISEHDAISRTILRLESEIDVTRRKVDELSGTTRKMERYLHQRLAAMYKYFRRSGLRILLSSSSYNEFLYQEHTLAGIVARDYELFANYRAQLQKVTQHQESLATKKGSLVMQQEKLLRARDEIKNSHAEKTAFLKTLKEEKNLQRKALQELEEYSRELQSLVEKLPDAKKKFATSGIPFTRMKGKLDFPINGTVISSFGRKEHPELNTFTFQKGIEIKAPKGTEIKAIHDGRVVFADWFKGYGHMIIIDHGESYYSLSAHASKLFKSVDDIVRSGDVIALVGDTNSMKGDCLYFEIRHHGTPQNPLVWLKRDNT